MKRYIEFPCLKVAQPIGTFYLGVIDSHDLVAISYADVRRPDGRDLERYIGTQRDLSEARVTEIKQYVTTVDASFPTSIILSIDSENTDYDEENRTLTIVRDDKVAKIIDGQHRIAGLEGYSGSAFQINVTIFVDMELEDQAMVFATINLKQTKVTKSLAYDLYEYAESRSPQKTCHNIAKLLNSKKDSPFYQRIKILGKASGSGPQLLTQSTFVDRLLKLISKDPMRDKDDVKRRQPLEKAKETDLKTRVFRNRFIDGRDAEIAKVLWNYFKAVERRWPTAWNDISKGMILARSTGFAALIRLLPEICWQQISDDQIPDGDFFLSILQKCSMRDEDFTSSNFIPGSSGESALFNNLKSGIG